MEDKRIIAIAWCQRIITLRRITRKEFERAIGTLQFDTAGLQQGNIHLARSFRALHVAALWKGKKKQMTIPDWLRTDLLKYVVRNVSITRKAHHKKRKYHQQNSP